VAADADPALDFGDRVQIRATPETVAAGIDGRIGQVYGQTTPSKGYLTDRVIGEVRSDLAFNVQLDESDVSVWIVPDLLELIDHAPGTTIGIGDASFVRQQDGSWERTDR
jgi:hypothetical protein